MMRRVTLMLAAMALIVSLFAAVAYAADIYGTDKGETLFESEEDDVIIGRQGGDDIVASLYGPKGELRNTPADRDVGEGNRGDDRIFATDGDGQDVATGGEGHDKCWGDPGDELDCEVENGQPNPLN
jgi:RTX calcium-binding nonapeptide repeat (4 copies)